ncbi:aldehyde dehydrogenase family protein (plasmid) [Novosphingobium resinovorum]|uniref:aldehyde dehydrogenase family protein n=1 Tax=Novosphingobium TaxID=165696 RepID=UPI001B3C82D5|nr:MULTISPECIES: aldehyde dehydrogenase family protein [Novosphingobium]MBF7015033.1 aldehyde dehydrogenase family protein [Novosphingobium sp. HR1a]WJM29717.1 aldehyde dehydrogenase family protein [Novosphingobium resinovorum]
MTHRFLIDGNLVEGALSMDVIDPTTARPFERSPHASVAQAEKAVVAARRAQRAWAALGYEGRRPYLERFADAMAANAARIAETLTRERGGPIADCRFEVGRATDAIRHFASQKIEDRVIRENERELIVEQHYPQGVVVAIMPWNRPMTLLSFKLGPALITGNTVIAKPAPSTPLSTLMLGEIAADIFPRGVFQTLVDANDLGAMLSSHPDVAHVSFTGSTPTGKKVLTSAADTLKRFTLELGGNDAAIVLDDVDIEWAADRIYAAAFINAGQVCYATKRVYAPRKLADDLAAALARRAEAAILGDGMEPATTMGPLQNRMQFDKVLGYIASAKAEGGTFLTGGEPTGQGYFIAPSIVTGLPDDARLVLEEQFGPVLPIQVYDDLDEAIIKANDVEYGLGGTIWTSDVRRGIEVASRIETGTIWVNQHMALPLDVPFGGAKESGIGLQNGIEGMKDFTQLRILNAKLAA